MLSTRHTVGAQSQFCPVERKPSITPVFMWGLGVAWGQYHHPHEHVSQP